MNIHLAVRKNYLWACFILLLGVSARANDSRNADSLLLRVLPQLNLNRSDIYEELYVQKVLPYDTLLSVVVLPKIVSADASEDLYEFDAYILLVNNSTGKIVSRFFEANAWTSDAVRLADIEIDTAPYRLSPSVRAFGIRINYRGSSRPNPYDYNALSLFMVQNDAIKRILDDYSVYHYSGEWDTNCQGVFVMEEATLAMDKKQLNGLHDIHVKRKISHIENQEVNGECKAREEVEYTSVVLRFNGVTYEPVARKK